MSAHGVFVAGTDTGIGKTLVSVALLHALRASGRSACGMKPVASGCEQTSEGPRNADALALLAASEPAPGYAAINPVALAAPVSPHLAAAQEGVTIDLDRLHAAYARLAGAYDAVVVEGVGGWMAPLGPGLAAATLPQAFDLPVILVVGMRLGCLNHAQLSARAIRADGCRLLGWVGNAIDPDMALLEENVATLEALLPAPCLGRVGHAESAPDAVRSVSRAVAAMCAPASG